SQVYAEVATPIEPFGKKALNSLTYKTIYLRNIGTRGMASYKGVKVSGSSAFTIYETGLARRGSSFKTNRQVYDPREDEVELNLQGADASSTGYRDFFVTLAYAPETVGDNSARITILHDGPGGETS